MAIFKETSFMLTTRHGHPIHRDPDDKHAQPFPWKGIGYLRLRNYQLLTPAGAYVKSAMPGMADLTFKMKKVDPDVGPGELQLPHTVCGAKITAKVENDMHCDHARATMSPLFRPVSQTLNISKIGNVKDYFPNLAEITMLDENEPLPFMHEVYRAKIVWTVVYKGVVGEANLVIKYNTTFEDAVAGNWPKNGELSLRIRREVAESTGTTGKEGVKKLYEALHAIGDAMQVFRDAGWDGKTPSLPKKGGKDKPADGKPDCDCDRCKHCDCKHCDCKGSSDKDCSCDCHCDCSKHHSAKDKEKHKGCGCKCDCHCGKHGKDSNKKGCGCGCKCGCDCGKHCDCKHSHAVPAIATQLPRPMLTAGGAASDSDAVTTARQSVLSQQQQLVDAVRNQGDWFHTLSGSTDLQPWWTAATQWLTRKSAGAVPQQQLAVPEGLESDDLDCADDGDCGVLLDSEAGDVDDVDGVWQEEEEVDQDDAVVVT
eukprot:GHUV01013345.1.p1 GENE.GHUV01013345.1~~GHUV01013345.1.p1  ORF type:complete len:482 (+),score=128.44 GHUV01013345.1:377-1822(+)